MSEEMAQKKREEIANLEKQEGQMRKEIMEDVCPCCGLPTRDIGFFNTGIIKTFGWVECTRCGNVYCPRSILKQKRLMASSGLTSGLEETVPVIQPTL
jgi:hypothetical protein